MDSVSPDPSRLSDALTDLYASTLDPADLAALPNRMAAHFGANSCLIHTRDEQPAAVTIVGATDNCAAFLPDYAEYWHARDAWAERGAAMKGRAFLGEEVVATDELLGADWYNDLLRYHEIHHLVAAVFDIGRGAAGVIGIHRAPGAEAFDTADRSMMAMIVPHLRQVLRLIRRLDSVDRQRRLGFEALSALATAVIVVGADNRVRMLNAAAERVIAAGLGVTVRQGRLTLADSKLDDRLKIATRKSALAAVGRSLFAGETLTLPRNGRAPLSLAVTPLPAGAASVGQLEPLAAVFITEPEPDMAPNSALLKASYGLAPAEARVLAALFRGQSASGYAAASGVSLNTVKTQIKSVFAKTECHNQADLVRRIASDPVMLLSRRITSDD